MQDDAIANHMALSALSAAPAAASAPYIAGIFPFHSEIAICQIVEHIIPAISEPVLKKLAKSCKGTVNKL